MSAKTSELSAALAANLPKPAVVTPVAAFAPPTEEEIQKDAEQDYETARKTLKNLLNTSGEALERLTVVANEAEHPRAFEVLSDMMRTAAGVADQLMSIQKKRKENLAKAQKANDGRMHQPGNVAVFIGTTADLQKQLASEKSTAIVDVSPAE